MKQEWNNHSITFDCNQKKMESWEGQKIQSSEQLLHCTFFFSKTTMWQCRQCGPLQTCYPLWSTVSLSIFLHDFHYPSHRGHLLSAPSPPPGSIYNVVKLLLVVFGWNIGVYRDFQQFMSYFVVTRLMGKTKQLGV